MTCLMADPRAGRGIEKSCRDLHWITLRSSTAIVPLIETQVITDDVADTNGWLDVSKCSQLLLGINFVKGNLVSGRILIYSDDNFKTGITHSGFHYSILDIDAAGPSGEVEPLTYLFNMTATIKTCLVIPNFGCQAISFSIVGTMGANANSQLQLYVMRSGMNSPVVQV